MPLTTLKIKKPNKTILHPDMSEADKWCAIFNMWMVEYMKTESRYCRDIGRELSKEWYGGCDPQKPGLFWYEDMQLR